MGGVLATFGVKLFGLLLPSLATVVSGLLANLLVRQAKKVGLDIDQKQSEKIKEIIADAIKAADEAARRDKGMTADDKRRLASSIIVSKVPQFDFTDVQVAMDAALQDSRKHR